MSTKSSQVRGSNFWSYAAEKRTGSWSDSSDVLTSRCTHMRQPNWGEPRAFMSWFHLWIRPAWPNTWRAEGGLISPQVPSKGQPVRPRSNSIMDEICLRKSGWHGNTPTVCSRRWCLHRRPIRWQELCSRQVTGMARPHMHSSLRCGRISVAVKKIVPVPY